MVVASQAVAQLRDVTVTDWVSDSSMSKLASGRLSKVLKSKSGLQLELSTGKKVSWRMPEVIANEVLSDLKAAEMSPIDEVGVEEVYDDTGREFSDEENWIFKNNW